MRSGVNFVLFAQHEIFSLLLHLFLDSKLIQLINFSHFLGLIQKRSPCFIVRDSIICPEPENWRAGSNLVMLSYQAPKGGADHSRTTCVIQIGVSEPRGEPSLPGWQQKNKNKNWWGSYLFVKSAFPRLSAV